MKKLAVLIPTYNSAQYLKESIDSILNQTYSNFDLYLYDDCSTDNSKEIIESYADRRIFYRKNHQNLGISKTLNRGFDELLSQYQFIARMDADDWAFPERFEKQIGYLEANKSTILCGTQGFWLKDMTENPLSGWKYPIRNNYLKLYLLFGASFGHSSIVLRSDFFISKHLKYDEDIKTCEDWDLWIKVSRNGEVHNLSDFLMKYRIVHTSNHRLADNKNIHLKERADIISNYWKTFNINLSPEQVFEYYYSSDENMRHDFENKLQIIIDSFNKLFLNHAKDLKKEDRSKFQYLLARKIYDFWKRSNVSRYTPLIWFILLTKVKFICAVRLINSQFK
ncbi:glycosyltransferase family 2 protein [Flavobacterium sp. CSZ]|uniref:glycosyltransferase family 2 protein n=1 Tax=Flavobacterium sp. CSZ TaxID=2783791 RepID=UPI00188CDF6E|nr:glycosyltransferase family 2 protein [Flavobacterium sp. CSZ]MBF4486020.1 glycosyltransferase family 2 protein [Flavobacterium sp. CSZ]